MMGRRLRLVLAGTLAAAGSLAACATAREFTVLRQGTGAEIATVTDRMQVIETDASYQHLLDALGPEVAGDPANRSVDFGRQIVLFAAMAPQPSAGYALSVREVRCDRRHLTVRLQSTAPRPDAITATVVTQPHVLIATPRCPGATAVRFTGDARTPQGTLRIQEPAGR